MDQHAGPDPHADAWEEALRPYFKATRFDALGANAEQRQQLFAVFAVLMITGHQSLIKPGSIRKPNAGSVMTSRLPPLPRCCVLTMSEEAPLSVDRDQQTHALAKKLFTSIRQREQACRVQVVKLTAIIIYNTLRGFAATDTDLLDRDKTLAQQINRLPAPPPERWQVASLAASVAPASRWHRYRAAIGSIGALWGGHRLAKVRVLGHKLGGKRLRIEAPESLQFAFVLLDRALLHWHQVAGRAHARRDELLVDTSSENGSIVTRLKSDTRKTLTKQLTTIRALDDAPDKDLRDSLQTTIANCGPDAPL